MSKKPTYLKLSREAVVEAVKMAESGAFIPEIATKYGLTFASTEKMLLDQLAGKENIRYKKYGNKRYRWLDPNIKEVLKGYINEGWNDDDIAQFMETSAPTIARARSECGFVKFKRIVGKGHSSPHEFSHVVNVNENGVSEVIGEARVKAQQIMNKIEDMLAAGVQGVIDFENNPNKGFKGVYKQIAKQLESNNEITEVAGDKERTIVCNPKQDPILMKPVDRITGDNFIVKLRDLKLSTSLPKGVLIALKNMMNWREIAIRLQNPVIHYVVKGTEWTYFFRQLEVDPINGIVELEWVSQITVKSTKDSGSLQSQKREA